MNSAKGFSLIEIVVATGIVGMIAIISTGIFTRFLVIQRYNIGQQALQEDTRFALELMNREIRTGYGSTFNLVTEDGSGLTFRNQKGSCAFYRLNKESGQIERAEISLPGTDCPSANFNNAIFAPITSPSTIFKTVRFDIVAAGITSEGRLERQGMVTIIIDAGARRVPDVAVTLQSTVTSRQVSAFEEPQL